MSKIPNDVRKAIYRRDGFQCAVCGDGRRLQIHHIQKRSQGGGNEQMNLITLCEKCHALAHGINLADIPFTKEDVEQTIVEYMSDLYADLGFRWPDGEALEAFLVREKEYREKFLSPCDRCDYINCVGCQKEDEPE